MRPLLIGSGHKVGLAGLCFLAVLPFVLAQSSPLPVEALLDLDDVLAVELTADGRAAAVQVMTPDHQRPRGANLDVRGAYRARLEVIDLISGRLEIPGMSGQETSNASWSPDGSELAFQVGLDDEARIWLWSCRTNQVRQLGDLVPRRLNARLVWTPDGRHLVVAVLPAGVTNDSIRQKTGLTKSDADYPMDDMTPGARVALYRAGHGEKPESLRQDFAFNNIRTGDLALIDVTSGIFRRLVTGHRPVLYGVSADGARLAFVDAVGQQQGSGYRNLYDLYTLDLFGGGPQRLMRDIAQVGNHMYASWSPDSRWVAWVDSGPGAQGQVYFGEVGTGKVRAQALPTANQRLVPPAWDPQGENVYLLSTGGLTRVPLAGAPVFYGPAAGDRAFVELITSQDPGKAAFTAHGELLLRARNPAKAESFLAFTPSTGQVRVLYEGAFSIGRQLTRLSQDGATVVFTRQSAHEALQVWKSEIAFTKPTPLTRLNPQLNSGAMGRSRLVEWRGLEGQLMQGALLLPPGYQPGQRCPLVVYLYGGDPLSDDLNLFGLSGHLLLPYENMQLLATHGYAVLRPDTKTRLGSPMRDIAASVLPAVDRLIEDGLVDPDRLGIMGRSYGGYSVMSVLVQTARFKAAIEVAGETNLLGVYRDMTPGGTTWKISWAEERGRQGKMTGSPWTARESYVENSPFFYLHQVVTPVLIAHGTDDTAVSIEAADELFLALRQLGKKVDYAKYLDESHVIHGRANSIDYANRMIAWFDRYLLKDSAPASKPLTDQ